MHGEIIVKLTTTRLKKIIKEELNKVLSEDKHLDKRFNSRKEAQKYLNDIAEKEGAEGDYAVSEKADKDGKWHLVNA